MKERSRFPELGGQDGTGLGFGVGAYFAGGLGGA